MTDAVNLDRNDMNNYRLSRFVLSGDVGVRMYFASEYPGFAILHTTRCGQDKVKSTSVVDVPNDWAIAMFQIAQEHSAAGISRAVHFCTSDGCMAPKTTEYRRALRAAEEEAA